MKKSRMFTLWNLIPWRWVLVFLGWSILVWVTIPLHIHRSVTLFVQQLVPKSWDSTLFMFSLLGSIEVTGLFVLICAFLIKNNVLKFTVLALFLLGLGVEVLGKTYLPLQGPDRPLWRSHSYAILVKDIPHFRYSFPSGHMYRSVFCCLLFIYLTRRVSQRNVRTIIVLLFVLGMAGSRVSLGEHWISDVVGGSVLGVVFGVMATKTLSYFEPVTLNKKK